MPVYQVKSKSKSTRNGNTWYYRCYYNDIYGNRKQMESKKFATKKEAQIAEREFLEKLVVTDQTDYSVTFKKIYSEWLSFKSLSVKGSTFYTIKLIMNKYVLSYFKDYKLHSIKINTIINWYEYINSFGNSIKSQNRIITYFKDFLSYARDNYDFNSKVANKLQKLKEETPADKMLDSEWNFLVYDEFKKLISVIDNAFDYLLIDFLYLTGLRIGEAQALNWKDIDFTKKKVKITKTLTYNVDRSGYDITSPKSKNSIRYVDLPNSLVKLLKEHKRNEEKIYGFNENMFVFGNVRCIPRTTLRNKLNKYIKLANVKRITIHGLRHSHVSLLIHIGCDSREVAKRIGDTVEMVEKTYYHMFPEKEKQIVKNLNDFISF